MSYSGVKCAYRRTNEWFGGVVVVGVGDGGRSVVDELCFEGRRDLVFPIPMRLASWGALSGQPPPSTETHSILTKTQIS